MKDKCSFVHKKAALILIYKSNVDINIDMYDRIIYDILNKVYRNHSLLKGSDFYKLNL